MNTKKLGLVGLLLLVGCTGGGLDHSKDSVTNEPGQQTAVDPTAPCEAAGGSCVAVYPGTCATGHSIGADACGGGLGVFCCVLDQPEPPSCTPLPAWAGAEPSGEYCRNLGYVMSQDGQCQFPDGTSCESWAFFRGACGQAHSFCALHGGTVTSETVDHGSWSGIQATCTLANGTRCDEQAYAHSCTCGG